MKGPCSARRGRPDLVGAGNRDDEAGDLGLPGSDERVELRYLAGVLALLVLAEAEEVRLVLRPPAVEEQLVLDDDHLAQGLRLLEFGPAYEPYPAGPLGGAGRDDLLAVDRQDVLAGGQALDDERALVGVKGRFRRPGGGRRRGRQGLVGDGEAE